MIIGGLYSFNGGLEAVTTRYAHLWREVREIVGSVDADKFKVKVSEEKTTRGQVFYGPSMLNVAFKEGKAGEDL